MSMEAVSPWMAKTLKALQTDPEQNGTLAPESQDALLRSLAGQTIQPYRSGWAALPGVGASIVGGLASQRLNANQQERSDADRRVDQAVYAPASASRASNPTPTLARTDPSPAPVAEYKSIDEEERKIYEANPANPKPVAKEAQPSATNDPVKGMTSGRNLQLGQPSLSDRVAGKVEQLRSALALPMSASKRTEILNRIQKLEGLSMQLQQGAEAYARGAPERELNRRLKEVQIARLEKGQRPPTEVIRERHELGKQYGLTGQALQQFTLTGDLPKASGNTKPITSSPTVQKMIGEADSKVEANTSVLSTLDQALQLNDKAWYGPKAAGRAAAGSTANEMLPDVGIGWTEGANETIELDNLITNQALTQLKAIFGGMPTEGERRILLEVQGSVNQSPTVRRRIYEAAKKAATRRLKINQLKAKRLRDGTYFEPGGQPTIPNVAPSSPNTEVTSKDPLGILQ